MAQGFQTFNADESIDVDVTDRLPRFLGSVAISTSQTSGRVYNAGINEYTDIWWFLIGATTNFSAAEASSPTYEYPTITKGNGYLEWSFPKGRALSCTLLYGVY